MVMEWMDTKDKEATEAAYDLMLRSYSKNGDVDDATLKWSIDTERALGDIKEQIPISQVWDLSLLREVLKETPAQR